MTKRSLEQDESVIDADAKRLTHGFCRLAFMLLCFLCFATAASAQSLDVKIKVVSVSPARVRIEGRRAEATTAWSFRNFYADTGGLAKRIENLSFADKSGAEVASRELAPGEFTAEKAATRFAYDLKLDPPAFVSDAAHVSWLSAERGLLMLGDLLPLPLTTARVSLSLPTGWSVSTTEANKADGTFDVPEAESSVFVIGRDIRKRDEHVGKMSFVLATAGDWTFTDGEAATSAVEILKIYEEMLAGIPRQRAMLVLVPTPQAAPANFWSAETRGSTVVLLSGRLPSKLAAQAQLDGSLAHELFHLWVPNGLTLDGEYDWFYEGFTNYQALRVGMRRGQLTFQAYLDALGRAFDAYKSARGARELSLPEASLRRWGNGAAMIYHKGMLVAFLYDLTLMRRTDGKSSLNGVYQELLRNYGRGGKHEDGNRAVVDVLGGMPGMRDFVARYVESAAEINLAAAIEAFGLRVEAGGARTHVGVAEDLDRSQRELLRKLGYNDKPDAAARKLHERMKKRPPQ
jgi:hypothetical protein